MNCDEIRLKLSAYMDEELSEIERERVRCHLIGCPSCARELRDLEMAADVLGSLGEIDPPRTVETGLRRRIRRRAAALTMVALLLALAVVPLWGMGSIVLRPDLPVWARGGFAISAACLSVSLGLLIFHLLSNVHSLVLFGYLRGGEE